MTLAPASAQGVSLNSKISVPGGDTKVTIRLRDTSLRDALQLIAEQKRLNFTIDDSVSAETSAPLNLDFFNTPLNEVLETVISSNGLEIQTIGSTYVVYRSGRYGRPVIRFIPLAYANAASTAQMITQVLTESSGSSGSGSGTGSSGGTSGGAKQPYQTQVRPDSNSNALIVSGQAASVQVVEQLVKRMDVLLPNRIFTLSHVPVTEAMDVLKASFHTPATAGGAAGGAAAGSGPSVKSTFRDFANTVPGKLPETKTETITIGEQTPRFIPLGSRNALMAVGSQAELALAEQIIQALDRKPPQVLIRTQIVQVEQGALQRLGLSYGLGSKQFTGGFDDASAATNGRFSFDSATNQAANLRIALDALVSQNKAKVLASPSVLAMHNRSSVIKITDDIISKTTTTIAQNANQILTTRTVELGEVGITLELTPRIDPQGSITMNVHPTISIIRREERAPNQDILATLKSTREFQTQEIRVLNGETIVIGGLIQDSNIEKTEKIPLLGDIPFLGKLFQRKSVDQNRTEVQILITPEIVNDAAA
ncbi:putative type II secretion system protein D precursor [compost metagenome]